MKYRTEKQAFEDERYGLASDPLQPVYGWNEKKKRVEIVGMENLQEKIQSACPDDLAELFDKYLYDDCQESDEIAEAYSEVTLEELAEAINNCNELKEKFNFDQEVNNNSMLAYILRNAQGNQSAASDVRGMPSEADEGSNEKVEKKEIKENA